MMKNSPFAQAETLDVKAKVLLWGSYGTGKTTLALQFPSPVLIDMERGADLYRKKYKFGVFSTTDVTQVAEAVEWLRHNKHEYRTVILDSMTEYWSALQEKWKRIFLERNKNGKGNKVDYYDLQAGDWSEIKGEFKELMRSLIALDMNVVVTAREKDLYVDEGKNFMKKVGTVFDCERNLPYLFDTVLHLSRDGATYTAKKEKDRTGQLPPEFPADFQIIKKVFGLENGKHQDAEVKLRENTIWLIDKVPFKNALSQSWEELATEGAVAKNNKDEDIKGRAYLHQLAGWKGGNEEIKLKAKIALELGKKKAEQAEIIPQPAPAPETVTAGADNPPF